MNRIEWTTGSHHLVVLDGVAVLLADEVPQDQVVGMWDALQDAGTVDGLGGLLDILRAATGRGLGSLPGFAMSVIDDRGLHVAARGAFDVHVTAADTEHVVRGDEASVWVERNFDAATVVDVLLTSDDTAGSWLPVVAGVLLAGAARQTLLERAPAPVEAPPADPVPASAAETWVEPDVDEPEPEPQPEQEAPSEVEAPDEAPEPDPVVEEAAQPAQGRFASLLSPHTVMHDVEEAAVRPDDHDDVEPDAPPADEPRDEEPAREPMPAPDQPAPVVVAAPPPSAPAAPSPSFISGVPSRSSYVSTPPTAPAVAPVQAEAVVDDGPEHHDGHTMFEAPDSTELDAYVSDAPHSAGADSVLGVMCPAGHGNPTHRTECRVCGQRLTGDSVRFARPGLGWLHTSAGESIELVQNVLAGRNPRASRIQGTVMPRLLPLPHSHVSGTHLEIRLEGWSVMVADLGSTNGTFLQRPGQPTVRISETPQLLQSDDVVQLGHGVDLRFEALP